MNRPTLTAGALIVGLALAITGCSESTGATGDSAAQQVAPQASRATAIETPAVTDGKQFVALVAYPIEIHEVASGPRELGDMVDVVVEGTVTDVVDGRVVGDERRRHSIVLKIKPTKYHKSPDAEAPGEVLIELQRAVNRPSTLFRDAIATGTRVFLFGYESDSLNGQHVASDPFAGRAASEHIYRPDPQGLFIDVDRKAVSVFAGPDQMSDGFKKLDSMEAIAAELESDPKAS